MDYDVIVIGGGASGMMAAGRAAERGRRVLLLEKNGQVGKKLSITGGGRCNITNAEEDEQKLLDHYGPAKPFLHSPFSQFGVRDTFSFFESRGLPLVEQAHRRVFPKSERAVDVTRALMDYLGTGGVEIRTNAAVDRINVLDGVITAVVVDGHPISASAYVLATGGASHPETGSTGDGFAWLSMLGHRVKEPTPTIVPLAVADEWVKQLAGKVLPDVRIGFSVDGARKLVLKGNVLCTHFGLSGPRILNAAVHVADMLHEGVVTALIDVYPDEDIGTLDRRIMGVFDANKNKSLKNTWNDIAPPGTGSALMSLLGGIDMETKVHSITKEQRRQIVNLLKGLPVTITGLMGYDRAVIADGGLALEEVDMRTMRSLRYANLFVTGDLLHISRPSGGYSLQLCWTTGYVAGNNA
jgi:predicted Rossmann fold flavoprotein